MSDRPRVPQRLGLANLGLGLALVGSLAAQLPSAAQPSSQPAPGAAKPTAAGNSAPRPIPAGASSGTGLNRGKVVYDTYILGPGDSLQVELLDIPEFSGTFTIGPDGTLYLPRLRALYVEGLTVEELRYFLTQQFRAYVRSPEVYVRPVGYRPIRVYVAGEVRRPGYYTLSGVKAIGGDLSSTESQQEVATGATPLGQGVTTGRSSISGGSSSSTLFPTVFDAIRTAQGITPYSNLSEVQVTRKQALSAGGGKIRTQLNFLSLITQGDESQNIRLFDGDVVSVGRSPVVLREQLLKAGQTNLSPQFLQVYVSGRVKMPGGVTVPQGASLTQAISLAGGTQLLKGKVEFIRFTREGEIDRRIFSYNPNAASDTPDNPVLMAGDVIRVQDSALSAGISVLNELAGPFVGLYSVYSIFK
ncbi:MAG: polysaccharide biosynthesis/export family protein [Synechococcus sp. ELA057]